MAKPSEWENFVNGGREAAAVSLNHREFMMTRPRGTIFEEKRLSFVS
jgi:hypothetical protein